MQIPLVFIYTGMRVGELWNLKTEDVHLAGRYFEVTKSKTDAGIRTELCRLLKRLLHSLSIGYLKILNMFLPTDKAVNLKTEIFVIVIGILHLLIYRRVRVVF